MNAKQLQWLNEADEVSTPVEWAEQYTAWTVADESGIDGLLFVVGRTEWEAMQDRFAEWFAAHPDAVCRWSGGTRAAPTPWGW